MMKNNMRLLHYASKNYFLDKIRGDEERRPLESRHVCFVLSGYDLVCWFLITYMLFLRGKATNEEHQEF